MKKKYKLIFHSSSGFSLTEILIAMVILGLAGATIINGMTTDTKIRGKTNTATNISVNLNAAAEVLLSSNVALNSCNSTAVSYYSESVKSIPNVSIFKVEALARDVNPTWINCDTSDSKNIAAQRITLQSIYGGKTIQKVILKTSASNANIVATPFSITTAKSSITIAAEGQTSCGAWDTTVLSNSLNSSSIVYVATSTDPTIIRSSILGSNLRIEGISSGNSTVTVQGINPINGVTSNPITITANVYPAITFTAPSPKISVVSPYGRQISGSVLFSGGSSPSKIITSLDSRLTISNTSYTVDARSINTANNYDFAFALTDNSLPNASGCISPNWTIPIKVQLPLAFTLDPSSRCVVGTNLSCAVGVTFVENTGSNTTYSTYSTEYGTYNATNRTISYTGTCGTKISKTSFESNSLVNPNGDNMKIRFTLKGGTYSEFQNAFKVNFTYTKGTGSNPPTYNLNDVEVLSYDFSTQGSSSATITIATMANSPLTITSQMNPYSIEILELKSVSPKLKDENNSPNYAGTSYTVSSQTQLPLYCN